MTGMRWLRDIGVVIVVFVALSWWQTRDFLPSGTPAPALPGIAFAADDATLVYFFAPWCGVCKVSAHNAALLEEWLGAKVLLVGLDYDARDDVDAFIRAHDLGKQKLVYGDAAVRDAYKITAYPSFYIVGKDQNLAFGSVGYSTLLGMAWRYLVMRHR